MDVLRLTRVGLAAALAVVGLTATLTPAAAQPLDDPEILPTTIYVDTIGSGDLPDTWRFEITADGPGCLEEQPTVFERPASTAGKKGLSYEVDLRLLDDEGLLCAYTITAVVEAPWQVDEPAQATVFGGASTGFFFFNPETTATGDLSVTAEVGSPSELPPSWDYTVTSDDPLCLSSPIEVSIADPTGDDFVNLPPLPIITTEGELCEYLVAQAFVAGWLEQEPQPYIPAARTFDDVDYGLGVSFSNAPLDPDSAATPPLLEIGLRFGDFRYPTSPPRGSAVFEFTISGACLAAPVSVSVEASLGAVEAPVLDRFDGSGMLCRYTVEAVPDASWVAVTPPTEAFAGSRISFSFVPAGDVQLTIQKGIAGAPGIWMFEVDGPCLDEPAIVTIDSGATFTSLDEASTTIDLPAYPGDTTRPCMYTVIERDDPPVGEPPARPVGPVYGSALDPITVSFAADATSPPAPQPGASWVQTPPAPAPPPSPPPTPAVPAPTPEVLAAVPPSAVPPVVLAPPAPAPPVVQSAVSSAPVPATPALAFTGLRQSGLMVGLALLAVGSGLTGWSMRRRRLG